MDEQTPEEKLASFRKALRSAATNRWFDKDDARERVGTLRFMWSRSLDPEDRKDIDTEINAEMRGAKLRGMLDPKTGEFKKEDKISKRPSVRASKKSRSKGRGGPSM